MNRLRFVMVGGFLGAGKTTLLARLAKFYQERGERVGLVTNDQAQDLVDTHSLRAQGFAVQEVPGACFCCKFDELIDTVGRLQSDQRPDVILAEPVGSCTDLVATVVQPLKDLYEDRFEVAPYSVIFKPAHGMRILKDDSGGGFSAKAGYIFRKQLEEADAILINRVDELQPGAVREITDLIETHYPGTPVLPVSARTGHGFSAVTSLLEQQGHFGQKILDIDYDIYAAGEAEMGWLNSSVLVRAGQPFALDDLLLGIVERLGKQFGPQGIEVGHLKVIGLGDTSFGVANLISSSTLAELSLPSRDHLTEANVIVNARVVMDPTQLEHAVRETVADVCRNLAAEPEFRKTQSLRPGRPTPTHRYPESADRRPSCAQE